MTSQSSNMTTALARVQQSRQDIVDLHEGKDGKGTVQQMRQDIVALHEGKDGNGTENTMTFALHAAQMYMLTKQCDRTFRHCEKIMDYCTQAEHHDNAKSACQTIQIHLGEIQKTMGGLLARQIGISRRLMNEGGTLWEIVNNPDCKKSPKYLLRQFASVVDTETGSLTVIDRDLQKSLEMIELLKECGDKIQAVDEGEKQSLMKVVSDYVKQYGGAELSAALQRRLQEKMEKHASTRAKCEEEGRSFAHLKGKEANAACKVAVLRGISERKSQKAEQLNLVAEQVRAASKTASQEAAEAVDKRWHTKKACGGEETTSENNIEQAQARADKFRAYTADVIGDAETMDEKAQAAAAKLGETEQEVQELSHLIADQSQKLIDALKDCDEAKAEVVKVKMEIEKQVGQNGGMDLQAVAEMSVALNELPRILSGNSSQESYIFHFWEQGIKASQSTLACLKTYVEAAKNEEIQIPCLNGAIIPSLKKMMHDADSASAQTAALHKMVENTAVGQAVQDQMPDAEPVAKRSRTERAIDVPGDDEPIF